jgi:hypothetical protein
MTYMQGDSWLMDIIVVNDFLGLGDKEFLINMSAILNGYGVMTTLNL